MKKVICVLFILILCLSLFACAVDIDKMKSELCENDWFSADCVYTINEGTSNKFSYWSFDTNGTCKVEVEEYEYTALTNKTTKSLLWKADNGKIEVYDSSSDSDEDTIYLDYSDGKFSGSAPFCDSFTLTPTDKVDTKEIKNQIDNITASHKGADAIAKLRELPDTEAVRKAIATVAHDEFVSYLGKTESVTYGDFEIENTYIDDTNMISVKYNTYAPTLKIDTYTYEYADSSYCSLRLGEQGYISYNETDYFYENDTFNAYYWNLGYSNVPFHTREDIKNAQLTRSATATYPYMYNANTVSARLDELLTKFDEVIKENFPGLNITAWDLVGVHSSN